MPLDVPRRVAVLVLKVYQANDLPRSKVFPILVCSHFPVLKFASSRSHKLHIVYDSFS